MSNKNKQHSMDLLSWIILFSYPSFWIFSIWWIGGRKKFWEKFDAIVDNFEMSSNYENNIICHSDTNLMEILKSNILLLTILSGGLCVVIMKEKGNNGSDKTVEAQFSTKLAIDEFRSILRQKNYKIDPDELKLLTDRLK